MRIYDTHRWIPAMPVAWRNETPAPGKMKHSMCADCGITGSIIRDNVRVSYNQFALRIECPAF